MSQLLNSERLATEYALIKSQRPCLTVAFDKICPYTVGQFIYMFEATTSLAGKLLNIDAYDQPAVELGKEATFALMGRTEYADLAQQIKPIVKRDDKYFV